MSDTKEITGVVEEIKHLKTKAEKPFVVVIIGGNEYSLFGTKDFSLADFESSGIVAGDTATASYTEKGQYKNLVSIKSVSKGNGAQNGNSGNGGLKNESIEKQVCAKIAAEAFFAVPGLKDYDLAKIEESKKVNPYDYYIERIAHGANLLHSQIFKEESNDTATS